MASKRYTRKNPDPNSLEIISNPQNLLRKRKITEETQSNNITIGRSYSLPEGLFTIEDLELDSIFEISLFMTKAETFTIEIVVDETVLRPYILPATFDISQFDKGVLVQSQLFESLVDKLQPTIEKSVNF